MLLIRLWRFIKGYLIIRAEGRGTEKFVNLSVTRGIQFWDLKKNNGGAVFKIPVKIFQQLRPLVRKSRCRLKIQQKKGVPFILKKTRRRKGFVTGIVIFIISVYVFTSFIWYIDVSGLDNINEEEVLGIGRKLGIKPGVYKGSLDLAELEKELARLHRDIAWAGLSYRGTVLRIEIAEHIPEPVIDKRTADLVASKDGLILKLLVIEGKAMVEPGDIVSEGDILIKGVKDFDDFFMEEADEDFEPPKVRARGEAEARVWYEAREPVIEKEVINKPTGRTHSHVYINWSSGKITLKGSSESPFPGYSRDILKRKWSWRNISLPVELITVTYNELKSERRILPEEEAVNRAKKLAREAVLARIPDDAEKERLFYEEHRDGDSAVIRAVAETREDIAGYRVHKTEFRSPDSGAG